MTADEMRIGDKEREGAVNALGDHYASGRLTKEEYDERVAVAYSAKTESTLRPLFGDLPGPHPFAVASTRSSTAGGQRTRPSGPGSWAPGPPPGWSQRPTYAGRGPQRGFRMPVLPLGLLLVGLAIQIKAPWLVFVGLGGLFFARAHRRNAARSSAHGWAGCGR